MHFVEGVIGGGILTISAGGLTTQANGECWIRYKDTVVLVTAVISKEVREGVDFLPLIVDYQERAYAAGKIPGGFIKREGKPSDKEILSSRLIDRSLRPLFNELLRGDIHITATVLSSDLTISPVVLGIIGASTALSTSDIPFEGPIGAVEIGRLNGNLVINPTLEELEKSEFGIVVAGTRKNIVMVDGYAKEIREEEIVEAIKRAHVVIKEIIGLQERIVNEINPPPKGRFPLQEIDPELEMRVRRIATPKIEALIRISDKRERDDKEAEALKETIKELNEDEREAEVRFFWHTIKKELVCKLVSTEGKRVDGRGLKEIRPISAQAGILPRTHGSGLFGRGQTKALVVTTLGTTTDEQIIDDIEGRTSKRFMVHYYFPPFSVGEAKPLRAPGRREIGHGALAEKALLPLIPPEERFPYTIRLVSDILDSNGSTSMATVCGGTLALMDAGVPITAPCAGISIGLIKDGDKMFLLRDITGLEDAAGDMDFKVAGTMKGVTALQLDLKIDGIPYEVIEEALKEAREGRLFILDEMKKAISKPRENLSIYAPRVIKTSIPPEKIGDVIGPGGKTIRNIINITGAKIDIQDDGKVSICAPDEEASIQALEMIEYLTAEVEVGKVYLGKVLRITKFGAFVEILPGKEGLVHISELAPYRVRRVQDVVNEGDEIRVKVTEIDEHGRINLSRRQVLYEEERFGRRR